MADTKQQVVAEAAVLDTKEARFVPSETDADGEEKNSMSSGECDPNDARSPKNWSTTKKHLIFVALMSSSLLCDGYVGSHEGWMACG